MKKIITLTMVMIVWQFMSAQVGIGTTTPDASAALDVTSNAKGMLVPRMSSAQRVMISSPAQGLLVYDTDTESFWFKGSTTWMQLIDSTKLLVHPNGNDIYMGMDGNTGIGITDPANKLDIQTGSPRTGTHATGRPLYITGDFDPSSNGVEFRHNNGTVGIGFGYNGIYAAGSSESQGLGMAAKGTTGLLYFNTNDSTRMLVSGSGNVGINNAEPSNLMDIHSGSPRTGLHATNRPLYITGDFDPSANGVEFRHNSGTEGIGFGYNGIYAAGSNESQGLGMAAKGTTGLLYFNTNDTTRMLVSGTGKVGINNATPTNLLDIHSGSARTGTHGTNKPLYVTGNFSPSSNGVEFRHNNGTEGIGFGYNGIYAAGSNANQGLGMVAKGSTGILYFNTNDTTRFRILGNGDVGIDVNPANQLDIHQGAARSGTHASNRPLYITGDLGPTSNGIEFRHNNGTQGIGFGYNGIYAAGSIASQSLGMAAKGTAGTLYFNTRDSTRMTIKENGNVKINKTLEIGYTQVASGQYNVPPGQIVTGTCDCPPGTAVISGGYFVENAALEPLSSHVNSISQWAVSVENTSLFNQYFFTISIICARLAN